MKELHRRRDRQLVLSLVATIGLVLLSMRVPEHRVILLNVFMVFVVLALSLDLLVGDLHLLAGGHAAFFGAGSYVSILLCQEWGWPLPLAAVVAVVVVALLALFIGWPATIRTAGMHFAIVTFAFGELLVLLVNNNTDVTGGSEGLTVRWGLGSELPFDVSIYRYFSFWLAGAVLLTLAVVVIVRNSQLGLRLKAIREDPVQARGMGYNLTAYRTGMFVLTSVIAGLVGVLYAPMNGFVNPGQMSTEQSIYILGLIIVGGMGRILGVALGVGVLLVLPQYYELDPVMRPIIVGGAMAVVVLVEPGGLAALLQRGWDALRRVVSTRGGGHGVLAGVAGGPGAEPDVTAGSPASVRAAELPDGSSRVTASRGSE